MKNFKNSLLTLTNGLKSSTERKKNFGPNLKKLLKNRLSIRVRNFAPLNEPPNICIKFFYFNPNVRHVTGTGSGLLGGIPRVVVQISALTLKGPL